MQVSDQKPFCLSMAVGHLHHYRRRGPDACATPCSASLTATLGTVGATQVRFLFGFPFSILFLLGVCVVLDRAPPVPAATYWLWVIEGAAAQFAATALMLAAMGERSFVVTIAYIKTEPIQVALFGFVPARRSRDVADGAGHRNRDRWRHRHVGQAGRDERRDKADGARPSLRGLFGLSAIGFRGAILNLNDLPASSWRRPSRSPSASRSRRYFSRSICMFGIAR